MWIHVSALEATSRWLQWLGLNHSSNPELMRERLAGPYPVEPLDTVASLVEPTKGYSRHAERYGIFSILNRLEFAIPSESDTAREFRKGVDEYLADKRTGEELQRKLVIWEQAAKDVTPMMTNQSILTQELPVAEGVQVLSQIGQEVG